MHQFKELLIWKKSRLFCSKIYSITSTFPNDEKFGIINQLRRAAVSIPSNIAEGSSRNSNKDFARFLEIAIGSAYEVETQLLISSDLGFLNEENTTELISMLEEITKMTSRFRATLL
ncbi:four helix bundle protein [Flavobacterium sp. YO12]|uniref:four helix bundle protein n=1 Tax=unclassified Flavobacterium TaxID=196869 RepID=UPI00100AE1D3|nr:four helix bundle protein [Flavobacterium sp. YO12]RXM47579.1 diversity-generating retroelement protein bAvd family protein [Flavobacterium sp. YO12]